MPELDPVILAAMAEDPNEDEEEKAIRKKYFDSEEEDTDDSNSDDTKELEDDVIQEDGAKDDTETKGKEEEDTEDKDDEEEDPEKLSRKEKRQERKSFFESIKKDQESSRIQSPQIPTYEPIDYKAAPEDGFDPNALAEDRDKHGAIQFLKGTEQARYAAEQDKFWSDVTAETKVLGYDPKLNFLVETLPDGKKNDKFDPDRTAEVNEVFLGIVGYKEHQAVDQQGNPLFDRATGQPIISHRTVNRTDISYDKFARTYVGRMENWAREKAEEREEEVKKNISTQRKNQGIRPTGSARKSIGNLKEGDISRMSDEEFAKHEAEIEKQILNML